MYLFSYIMPKRNADESSLGGVTDKRKRAANWSQSDTELLASLVITMGKKGILSKETNVSTNQIKDAEWAQIQTVFNATDTVRKKNYFFIVGRVY